ncbi:MAG: C2 family cysteine protease [Myxococcales bacterium]
MGLKIGGKLNSFIHKVEAEAKKVEQKVEKTVKQAVDKFESNEMVKQGKEFLQATADSFEQAVHHRNPADPTVLRDHQGSAQFQVPNGQLFVDGAAPSDVKQGAAGDCYYLSTLASMADTHPDLVQNAIKDNGDGTYTVTFHVPPGFDALKAIGPTGGLIEGSVLGLSQKLGITPGGKTVQVTVDGDVPTMNGRNLYARQNGNENWVGIMEKAYAKLWGNYGAMANGGSPSTAMYALTGKPTHMHTLTPTSGLGIKLGNVTPSAAKCNEVFADLKAATDAGKLVVANTYQSDKQAPAGLVTGHSYTVLGTSEHDGQRFIQLRNPWGHQEPGADGRDDGIFELPIEQFATNYASYNVGDV